MVIVTDPASKELLTVGSNKAARVTLYAPPASTLGAQGNVGVLPRFFGSYRMPLIRGAMGAITTNAYYWSLLNGSVCNMVVRSIDLAFVGTHAALTANTQQIEVLRFHGPPLTGGTRLLPVPIDSAFPQSTVSDARYSSSTALTLPTETVVDPAPLFDFGIPTSTLKVIGGGRVGEQLSFCPFIIKPAEGIVMRFVTADINGGLSVKGSIGWDEVPP